jgi:hypothetical protein
VKKMWFLAMLLLTAAACSPSRSNRSDGEASTPDVEVPLATSSGVTSLGPYSHVFPDSLVQNTYETAVDLCFYDPPAKLASEFRVANDREAIARAYSMGSTEGAHQDAAYVGCLEGLSGPGAGQRKQFGH